MTTFEAKMYNGNAIGTYKLKELWKNTNLGITGVLKRLFLLFLPL